MKEAYYFPHFCNARHDRKIKRLRKELGVEGYGIYFMLLEVLREQQDMRYPLTDIDLIADEFNTSEQKVVTVIKAYELFEIDEQEKFFSPKMLVYLEPYFRMKEQRREAGLKSGEKRKANLLTESNDRSTTVEESFNENEQSKVKKSKEEEIKENEIIIVSPKVEPKQKTFKQFTLEDFKNDIAIYKESYTSKTLNDFYIYWIEKNTKGIMKFQLQKTWETELRLKTWAKNEENFKPIQTYQKGNIVQPEPLKQENPLELLPNRIAEIYNIGQLENLGQQKCKSMFGYITKETPDKFLNESEKWYKVLYL